jgi:hypothetical protein
LHNIKFDDSDADTDTDTDTDDVVVFSSGAHCSEHLSLCPRCCDRCSLFVTRHVVVPAVLVVPVILAILMATIVPIVLAILIILIHTCVLMGPS